MRIFVLNNNEDSKKEMQSNQEIHEKQLLGILKLIRNTSLVFFNYGYNVLTMT